MIVQEKLVPPDGGWGWIVLCCAVTINFLIPGTVKSFGVLFVEFLQVFKASPTAASWMPALCYFLYSSLGPLSSILSIKYSYRTVSIIGGGFAAFGMMLSYFATSVSFLYVSYGLMVGIGAGLSFPPSIYIVTSYFVKYRGFANGICISGSAIGTIVLPPFLQYLLNHFGHRGAVLIMGAITLNTVVCAMLYHPVEQHMKQVPTEGIDNKAMILDETSEETKSYNQIVGDPKAASSKTPSTTTATTANTTTGSTTTTSTAMVVAADDHHLSEFSKYLEKTLSVELEEPEKKESGEKDVEKAKKETEKGNEEVGSLSRASSIKQHYNHLSRQHSIVSEMGPIALSPRINVNMFQRLFKTQNKWTSQKVEKVQHNLSKVKSISSINKDADDDDDDDDDDDENSSNHSIIKFFDFSVLKDPIYLVILISNLTSAISNTNFMILLPSYAIAEGFNKNMAALLLSVVSVFDLVGRIGGASLSDIDFVPKYYYFVCGLGLSGIALALLPMATSYTMLSFFCALFGLSSGMYIGITTVILADMLGTEKLSSSYGISLFVNGVLQLVGPPLCGVIFEHVGSYKPIFLAFGIILILGTALWALVPLINRNKKNEDPVV